MLQDDLAALTANELKAHLSKFNLLVSGNKDALVQRLYNYCNIQGLRTIQQLSDVGSDNEVGSNSVCNNLQYIGGSAHVAAEGPCGNKK